MKTPPLLLAALLLLGSFSIGCVLGEPYEDGMEGDELGELGSQAAELSPQCTEQEMAECCGECEANVKKAQQGDGEVQGGGAVCCCECATGQARVACSFVEVKNPGDEEVSQCVHEHEEGHIDQNEGVCTGVGHGHPTIWGTGQNWCNCEPDQYEEEIACLETELDECYESGKYDGAAASAQCINTIKARIAQLRGLLDKHTCP